MRRQSQLACTVHIRLRPAFAVVALACVIAVSGCENKKKSKESEIKALTPDFKAITEQLQSTTLESGVREFGENWTKFRLVPIPGTARFRLMDTMSSSEPYKLTVAVDYRMETFSKPFATAADAEKASYRDHDADFKFQAIAELVQQDDAWYLNSVTSQPPKGVPIDTPALDALLTKSIRRML